MKFKTIVGGALVAVAIAACTQATAAPVSAERGTPVRDLWYKESAPAISVDPPARDQWYKQAA